jgi:hypothetical protein
LTSAQRSKAQVTAGGVTITEPGVYELAALFKRANTVASVKILSGDTENYNDPVCKAEVLKGFKAASTGEVIYFGPCMGEKLGWEYVVFLLDTPDAITPKTASSTAYGTVHYANVFDEGYTNMETSYECVFDGKEIARKCDYGVRVCTDYIKLPKSVRAFPPESGDPPFGCQWVRKSVFSSLLDTLATRALKR